MKDYFEMFGATLDEVVKKSRIKYNPMAIDRDTDMWNIDFVSSSESDDDMDKLYFFSLLVAEESILRNMPVEGTLVERTGRLKQQLVVEERLLLIRQAIARSEHGKAAALLLIHQAIPCIMQCEKRVGEKILTMILSIGAELYQKKGWELH